MRGRKPKPTALKILHGNPGKRPLNDREPKPPGGKVSIPSHLDAGAKREWRRLAPSLEQMGLLTQADRGGFAAYCQTYSQWVQAEKKVQELGMVIVTKNGHLAKSPYLRIANDAKALMQKQLSDYGLTPVSRSRIAVDARVGEQDDLAAFLGETG